MKPSAYHWRRCRRHAGLLSMVLLATLTGCSSSNHEHAAVQVFAASSLTAPLQELARRFEQRSGIRVKLNLAASSFLAKQIEQHAPADVFVSASVEWTRYLVRRGIIDSARVTNIATNQLIVIVPAKAAASPQSLHALLDAQYSPIAVGDPSHVPVGIYAKEALQRAGLWQRLEPHILPTLEAAATLAVIGRGEAPAGIAYRNELYGRNDVRLAFIVPDSLQPEIRYTAAIPATATDAAAAQAFIDFVLADAGQQILAQYQLGTATGRE